MLTMLTHEYFESHNKEPRGRGYWAFMIAGIPGIVWAPAEMTLTEAKAWIKKDYPKAPWAKGLP